MPELKLTVDSLSKMSAERSKRDALRPREEDFKERKGYWRKPWMIENEDGTLSEDPSGGYDWGCDYTTNEGGTPTKEGAEIGDMLAPSMKADAEYQLNGGVRKAFKDAALADGSARRYGRTRYANTHGISVGRGYSSGMEDWQVRRLARRAGVKFSTVYAHSCGRLVSAWARRRIEQAGR